MKHLKFTSLLMTGLIFMGMVSGTAAAEQKSPNFVVLFTDDLGYGDLSCYGHPTIRTPNLDRMAKEGMRFTQFYSAANVCTPSRAALMTGRYPIRSGMCGDKHRVLFPFSAGGIQDSETTIAEALKTKGYATACIGKWHLGHLKKYLPQQHGFDYYFGIPYSNDMKPTPVIRGNEAFEEPAVQSSLTKRYTDEALHFIKKNKDKPFFVYLPYTFPHTPLHASERFRGKSIRGLYGDVVEEIDWSVGKILHTLKKFNLADNSVVMFTSDNGPWLVRKQDGGSAGLLREGKGTTWEGGHREPCIFWGPGRVKAGVLSREIASTLDVLPTFLSMAGAELPADRVLDGRDLTPVLNGTGVIESKPFFYYRGRTLMAVRKGPWKAHLFTQEARKRTKHDPPQLYHLDNDPSEKYNIAKQHPEVIADLLKEVEKHKASIKPVKSQLDEHLPGK